MKKLAVIVLTLAFAFPLAAQAVECEQVVKELNKKLPKKVEEAEVVEILRTLNATGGKKLPERYIDKRRAHEAGWRPGKDLWMFPGMQGKSIGGDRFINREGKLPEVTNIWREADLEYKGGRRGSKRILYTKGGPRFITVDHYQTFVEVPACQ